MDLRLTDFENLLGPVSSTVVQSSFLLSVMFDIMLGRHLYLTLSGDSVTC